MRELRESLPFKKDRFCIFLLTNSTSFTFIFSENVWNTWKPIYQGYNPSKKKKTVDSNRKNFGKKKKKTRTKKKRMTVPEKNYRKRAS